MNWREARATIRQKYVDTYDASEAERYDTDPGHGLSTAEVEAYWSDLQRVVTLQPGSAVLDVGAGTGELCRVLLRVPGVKLSALEPSPAMLAKLTAKLPAVTPRSGFTDAEEDRHHFSPSEFDAIVSRQVVCGLFDPLQAFKNWHYWLKPHGLVVVIDGLCSREVWTDHGQEYVDALPLSVREPISSMGKRTRVAAYARRSSNEHKEFICGINGTVRMSTCTELSQMAFCTVHGRLFQRVRF